MLASRANPREPAAVWGVRRFEDLIAWQKAVDLAVYVYEISRQGRFGRDFGLAQQAQKAAVSIPSNIAEGFERNMRKKFCRYLAIAKGSCGELITQLHIAGRVGYLTDGAAEIALERAHEVSRIIGGLRASLGATRTRHSPLGTRH